jgi:hypothetical protein
MDIKDQRQFLEYLADQYKFYGDTHTAFMGRFTPENVDKQNNKLGLTWTKADNDEQKIREELQKIYNALRENGCDIPKTKRGRSKKGESPWELAYAWLWHDKFPEWQKLQLETEKPSETLVSKKEGLDWRSICRQSLPLRRELTSNELPSNSGLKPKLDQVYVPLALVERRVTKEKRGEGFPGQPGSKEEEKLISISENSFFEEVLRQGRGESQGRRIAIIGEPGSGKTTRLQAIAAWILKDELGLPIWISLADLNSNKLTICQYLENVWLTNVGKNLTIDVLTAQKDRIWLLLDGVDEMTSRVERGHVTQLLTGWVQAGRVVMTCRVNVWEADKNSFSGFEVFRNLPFEPEQVELFIRKFFAVD